MTIGIDARFFGPRGKGLGRYTQKLIEGLQNLDSQNDYVIFLRRENFEEFQPKNSHFRKVLADYCWYSAAEQILLPFKIYQQKVDFMHFPHFNVPIFYFGPYVVTIHDLILQHFSTRRASTLGPLKYWFKNLAYKIVIRSALKRARKIITVSQYVKKDIIKCFGVKPEKIIVTYEGAPPKATISCQPPTISFKQYGIEGPYLLYVGNAYPHKNLERLIEAFEILIKNYKQDLQLVTVGEEDYFYRRLQKQANTSILYSMEVFAWIIFAGFVADEKLSEFYRGAAAYVFPSLCEGFGLPALEAMSQGVPVVVSNATSLPEILGEAAIYFNPLDPADIAKKLNQVLSDGNLRQNLIAKGFEQIKNYSWLKMGEETLKIYSGIKVE